jgi:hypothetical protein
MTIESFPLAWPAGKPRTPWHKIERSRFEPGNRPTEVANVQAELHRLGARKIIVSTNLRLRGDGLPYARDKAPDDQGVAVYFDYAGGQKCFSCDRWRTIEENLRAIFKSIEAIRGLERWGSKSFVDAAFTGFSALPAPGGHARRSWRQVLGIAPAATLTRDGIEAAYRQAAKVAHTDMGGSSDAMSEVNDARAEALQEISQP